MPPEHVHDDLPLIEIDVNGAWRPGRLSRWDPRPNGLWADVVYQTATDQFRHRTLPAEQVRPLAS